eukprot:3332136-Rhodomonas_salina.1
MQDCKYPGYKPGRSLVEVDKKAGAKINSATVQGSKHYPGTRVRARLYFRRSRRTRRTDIRKALPSNGQLLECKQAHSGNSGQVDIPINTHRKTYPCTRVPCVPRVPVYPVYPGTRVPVYPCTRVPGCTCMHTRPGITVEGASGPGVSSKRALKPMGMPLQFPLE